MRKNLFAAILSAAVISTVSYSQALRIPENTNTVCMTGRKVGVTEINIHYSAPGVKGREGKIYGTNVVHYGYSVLGFGSNVASPWRAGADECTTMSFSTDVTINGQKLPAGQYAFFIEVHEDSSVLIFNKNTKEWGSYFYRKESDVLHVATVQKKNQPVMQERLVYNFSNQTDHSVDISLDWERWSFPIHVEVDLKNTVLQSIREQMSGAIGFDPASLEAAAQWCVDNDINYEEALNWINSATNPQLGGRNTFAALSTKSKILKKMGKDKEATDMMNTAIENATVLELHGYGRQLLNEKKLPEALAVFQKNYDKNKGAWPTNGGLMRVYSAMGDYKKALEYAKVAYAQAPDDQNKKFLEGAIKTLGEGKAL
jgi:tetratricopeptide (TPR) repeat protein